MPPKMRLVLKFFGYLLPVLLLTTALTSANSNTVTFTGGYNSDPNSYYGIGPYTGTLGSQSELFYCVDFSHDITSGQSWNVTITGLPSTNFSTTRLGAGAGTTYLEMAWLATQLESAKAGSTQAAADQWAIWALSAGSVPIPAAYDGTTGPLSVSFLDAEAGTAVAGGYNGSGWEILTPTGSTGQEFLVATPEPSTWLYALGSILVILVLKQRILLS